MLDPPGQRPVSTDPDHHTDPPRPATTLTTGRSSRAKPPPSRCPEATA